VIGGARGWLPILWHGVSFPGDHPVGDSRLMKGPPALIEDDLPRGDVGPIIRERQRIMLAGGVGWGGEGGGGLT
jgi:hypothetical protein